ncbi:nuclear transport factor 2 family protein [Streptomyces diastatochromogenes]|uniref:nuclear transport factor 2 family protein n=1 Tax=Streptomyces diastatochromogenes TaxID=42236 RepID=UPI00364A9166
MTISPSDMTARVQEWADSFSPDGLDKFPGLYTEDAVVEDRSAKRTHRGRAEIRAWAEDYLDAVPGASIELRRVQVAPEHAVAQWVWSGTLSGRLALLPPSAVSGASFTVEGVSILNFTEDGLISREESYWNLADFLQQICAPTQAPTEGVRP